MTVNRSVAPAALLVALVAVLFTPGAAFGIHTPSPLQSGDSISHWTSVEPSIEHEAVFESLPVTGVIGLCIVVGVCILAGAFIIMRK